MSRTAKTRAPQQARAQATVEAIYEAAARILESEGMHGLTTARLAEVAGVGVGSIYEYFAGKEGVLLALCERHMHDVKATLDEAFVVVEHVDVPAAINEIIGALFTLQLRRARFRQAISRVLPSMVTLSAVAELDAHVQARLLPFLQARRAQLRVDDVATVSWLLVATVRGINITAAVEDRTVDERARIQALTTDMISRLLLP